MKKTTPLSFFLFVGITAILFACSEKAGTTKEDTNTITSSPVSPDSLIELWNSAWNTNDTAALANMLHQNSVVISGTWQLTGTDSILKNWVTTNIPKIANLKTTPIARNATADMAYYTGFYKLDLTSGDTVIGADSGNFSFVWKRQADNLWKLDLMHLGKTND